MTTSVNNRLLNNTGTPAGLRFGAENLQKRQAGQKDPNVTIFNENHVPQNRKERRVMEALHRLGRFK